MGETVKIWSSNILEKSNVTLTGTPDAGYPIERLYDRSQNLFWKVSAASADYTLEAEILDDAFGWSADDWGMGDDFGFSNAATVDLLFVANHNFTDKLMLWQSSLNGTIWTTRATWVQESAEPIVKTLVSPLTAPFWRLVIYDIQNPMCAEIFMSGGYSFAVKAQGSPLHQYEPGVVWTPSIGGQERGIKYADARERRSYTLKLEASDLANLSAVISDLDEFSLPFLVKDKDGGYYLMRFDPPPSKDYYMTTRTQIELHFVEML